MTYEEAISQLKVVFPKLKDLKGRFDIQHGMLWYTGFDVPDMDKLQVYINEFLGQKVYRAEYIAYKDVYAVSEKQAAEFLDESSPKILTVRTKIYETPEYSF